MFDSWLPLPWNENLCGCICNNVVDWLLASSNLNSVNKKQQVCLITLKLQASGFTFKKGLAGFKDKDCARSESFIVFSKSPFSFLFLFFHLSVCRTVCLSVVLSVYPSVSFRLSVFLSVCLFLMKTNDETNWYPFISS